MGLCVERECLVWGIVVEFWVFLDSFVVFKFFRFEGMCRGVCVCVCFVCLVLFGEEVEVNVFINFVFFEF